MATSSRANARVTFVVNKRTKTCWSTIELALGVCTRRMPIHMTKMSPPYVLPQHNDGPLSKWQGRSFLLFPSVYVNRHITLLQLVQADVGWVDGCRLVAHPFQKSDIYKSQLSVTTYHRFEQFISEFSTNKSSVIQTLDIWTTALDECPFI